VNDEARKLNSLVEAAIDELPVTSRILLVMREVETLSTAETAQCLGLSEETVRVRLRRARARLREELSERIRAGAAEIYQFRGARSDRIVKRVFGRIGTSRP
jgi:RNA polymerase sigma-70 factor (ECF subfamily)